MRVGCTGSRRRLRLRPACARRATSAASASRGSSGERRLHAPARAGRAARARASTATQRPRRRSAAPTSTSPAPCSVTGSAGSWCAVPTRSPLSALAPSDGRACASRAAAPATVAAAALDPFTVTKRGEPSAFAPGPTSRGRRRARRGPASRRPSNASPDEEKLADAVQPGVLDTCCFVQTRRQRAAPRAMRCSAACAAPAEIETTGIGSDSSSPSPPAGSAAPLP